jgi:hypothetical protein
VLKQAKERWGGLKTPHQQEPEMNTKVLGKTGILLRFVCSLVVKTSKNACL